MIPDLETILDALYFVARHHHRLARHTRPEVVAALTEAAALATDEVDEPAALFFAFAKRPATFGDLWPPMVTRIALGRANVLGFELSVDERELDDLRLDVRDRARTYAEVRDWFRARLRPVTPRPWPPKT